MKSGGPWNLRGLRPEAREAVRTAAQRSGVSVGEWLNDVIEPDDEEDDEPTLFSDYDDEDEERPRRSRSRRDEREPQRRDDDREPRQRSNDREARQHCRRIARGNGASRVRVRHLPGCLPLEPQGSDDERR